MFIVFSAIAAAVIASGIGDRVWDDSFASSHGAFVLPRSVDSVRSLLAGLALI